MKIYILLLILFSTDLEGCRKSEESTSSDCCADYYFKDGACVDCPVGTFGPNCIFECEYPWYGRRCLDKCDCSRDWCNSAFGCSEPVTSGQNSNLNPTSLKPNHPTSRSTARTSNTTTLPTTTAGSSINSIVKMKKRQSTMHNDWNDTTTTKHLTTDTRIKAKVVNDVQTTDNQNILVISVIGGFVILLLIVIIIVQIRSKKKKKVIKRHSAVLYSRDHVDTYCEIDDIMVPSTSEGNRKSNAGKYESIGQSIKEKTKYTTLPTKHRPAAERNSYLTPVSVAMETTDNYDKIHTKTVNMEQENPESPVLLRTESKNRNLNIPAMPNAPVASKTVSGYIDMNKDEKRDEYVAMEGQLQGLKSPGRHKNDQVYLMNDTYS